jgi:hypothetical protein
LDVHKEIVALALGDEDKQGEVRDHCKIVDRPAALTKLADKLAHRNPELKFCYEAGPCGYGIQLPAERGRPRVHRRRSLTDLVKAGGRIKTDPRDAINFAKLHRAGRLTSVRIRDEAHEFARDLVLARLAALRSLRRARNSCPGFCCTMESTTAGRPGR